MVYLRKNLRHRGQADIGQRQLVVGNACSADVSDLESGLLDQLGNQAL